MNDSRSTYKKAVALRYKRGEDDAPKVTAKGSGNIAEEIIESAREHGVPIQEDASLVEILSKIEVDQEIPPQLYQVVAEILSFIYRIEGKGKEELDGPQKGFR